MLKELPEMDARTARAIFRTARQLQGKLPHAQDERDVIRAFNQRWKVLGYEERYGKLPWGRRAATPTTRPRP